MSSEPSDSPNITLISVDGQKFIVDKALAQHHGARLSSGESPFSALVLKHCLKWLRPDTKRGHSLVDGEAEERWPLSLLVDILQAASTMNIPTAKNALKAILHQRTRIMEISAIEPEEAEKIVRYAMHYEDAVIFTRFAWVLASRRDEERESLLQASLGRVLLSAWARYLSTIQTIKASLADVFHQHRHGCDEWERCTSTRLEILWGQRVPNGSGAKLNWPVDRYYPQCCWAACTMVAEEVNDLMARGVSGLVAELESKHYAEG
ncbi:hypothetical protein MKEN_00176700 [Mycena kentingensis (nom. inval.)]|nr:hypothetical protein MKEN_00176700 [Mycena kentingensis (nom. inval.)]